MSLLAFLQYSDSAAAGNGSGFGGIIFMVIALAFVIFMIASFWTVFVKAGQPGWGAIVPIYNIILLLNIAKRPVWWVILMLIPFVSLVIAIIVCLDVARNFGKSSGFGVGLALLGFIFFPILAFGDARYQG